MCLGFNIGLSDLNDEAPFAVRSLDVEAKRVRLAPSLELKSSGCEGRTLGKLRTVRR